MISLMTKNGKKHPRPQRPKPIKFPVKAGGIAVAMVFLTPGIATASTLHADSYVPPPVTTTFTPYSASNPRPVSRTVTPPRDRVLSDTGPSPTVGWALGLGLAGIGIGSGLIAVNKKRSRVA